MSTLLWSTLPATLFYSLSLGLAYRSLRLQKDGKWVDRILWIALAYHWFVTLSYTWSRAEIPLDNFAEVLLTSALVTATLQIRIGHQAPQLRAITLLPVMAALLGAFSLGTAGWQASLNEDPFFRGHLLLSLTACAAWGISATLAWMHLLLENRLRQKQFDPLFHHLPPIQELAYLTSVWNHGGLFLGLGAVVLGLIWGTGQSQSVSTLALMASYGPIGVYFLVCLAKWMGWWNAKSYSKGTILAASLLVLSILLKAI